MCINEISLISGSTGESHNGIFRGKDLGTIANLNEYIAFRSAHGIDDKSYKDLYLGDYFKIQDSTYNAVWMVAHFDYYYNRGNTANERGVLLIPRTKCGQSQMNTQADTAGGYYSTIANQTTCPAIAAALSTVLGSYLLSNMIIVTNATNTNHLSMAGANFMGASSNWGWTAVQCSLPNEVQMYGTTVLSSSFYDVGEACDKLAVFNFINFTEYERTAVWLRSVVSTTSFARAYLTCGPDRGSASDSSSLRPLIYIG